MSGGVGLGSGFGADGTGFSVALGATGGTGVKGFGAGVHAGGFTTVGCAVALAFNGGSLDAGVDSPRLELAEGSDEGSAEVSG